MTQHTQKLLDALTAYESKCGIDPDTSILDAIWYDYSCRNPVDDGAIRASDEKLAPVFRELSFVSSDLLSDYIADLVTAYQRSAYLEGLRSGARLILEIT